MVKRTAISAKIAHAIMLAAMPGVAAAAGIEWTCSQEHDGYFHVQCIPRHLGSGDQGNSYNDIAVRNPGPTFNGRDMRPVSARGIAEVFSSRAWRVPLYSQPGNPNAVTGLLESVLCGTELNCTVIYDRGELAANR